MTGCAALAVSGSSFVMAAPPVNPPGAPARAAQAPAARPRPYTDQELTDAIEFMKANAPIRLEVAKTLRSAADRDKFELFIVKTMRDSNNLKTQSPKLYDLHVKQIAVDDEIYGIFLQIKQHPSTKLELSEKLKDKVTELFDLGVQERQVRIERLEKSLADQKSALTRDLKNRDSLIDKNFTELARKGVDGARLDTGGGETFAAPKDPKK